MKAAEADVITFPIKTKLVCSACGAPGEGSCRCGAAYVSPGERAAAAVKANPAESDRTLAKEAGVGLGTIQRARKKSGDPHESPKKRRGQDGKSYTVKRAPRRRGSGKTAQKYQQARPAVRDSIAAGVLSVKQIAAAQGVSVDTVERAALAEQARMDLLDELGVDPKTLSLSAQAKLEISKRVLERQLNAAHAARMHGLEEEIRQRVLKQGKEYLAKLNAMEVKARETVERYTGYLNNSKPPFTIDQFKTILMCLHPDGQRTEDKLSEAFRLFNAKKLQLTGERK